MNAAVAERYARCVKLSRKAEWQIDRDILRGRTFDFSRKFLPDGLSLVDRLGFLSADEARLLSQIQRRTYAYLFGLVERFISAKMLEQSRADPGGARADRRQLTTHKEPSRAHLQTVHAVHHGGYCDDGHVRHH